MELRIRIDDLKKLGLTLTQYLFMWSLYNNTKVKFLDIQEEGLSILDNKFFIAKNGDNYVLLEKGLELFEPSNGLFEEFLSIFPTRVNNQAGVTRVLSPVSADSLSGKKLKHKWHIITKSDKELQKRIVDCLKREVEIKKKEGNLYYMRNAETWLNKATWEDYEYLLDKPIKDENTGFKVNEIRL